jgi:nucleotide-binding universal stress UspA family protein
MDTSTILVATDLSARSADIVQKALPLAHKLNAKLHVVHIIEEKIFTYLDDADTLLEKAQNALEKLFPHIPKEQLHCQKGKISSSVAALANNLDAKLVILGSSGENGGLKSLFVGSSTKDIVRSLTMPALVVKTTNDLHVDKLLIPTDFSEASRWHIHAMRSLFPEAKITLLHTFVVPFSSRLSLYGVKKGDVNLLEENLYTNAKNKAALFMQNLNDDSNQVDIIVREGGLDAGVFTGIANMHGIQTISLHTTGSISLFAFDLLLETDKDVIINIV